MAATMRDQCQVSHRCDSYTSYQRGYCDNNPSANTGWRFDKYDLVEKVLSYSFIYLLLHEIQESTWPHNYYWSTEYKTGNYCTAEQKDEESSQRALARGRQVKIDKSGSAKRASWDSVAGNFAKSVYNLVVFIKRVKENLAE